MWTYDPEDVIWVRCKNPECLEPQLSLPLDSEGRRHPPGLLPIGTFLEVEGRGTHEGGDSHKSVQDVESLGEPPPGFLELLWEGFDG